MKKMIMNKKGLMLVCLVILVLVISGCTSSEGDKNTKSTKDGSKAIQDQEDDDNSNNPGSNEEWPSNIPSLVPEFTYGEIAGILVNRDDGSQWIIGYGSVQDDASEKYADDLESKGWNILVRGASLSAEYGSEEYVIILSHMKETQGAQLNIMKK